MTPLSYRDGRKMRTAHPISCRMSSHHFNDTYLLRIYTERATSETRATNISWWRWNALHIACCSLIGAWADFMGTSCKIPRKSSIISREIQLAIILIVMRSDTNPANDRDSYAPWATWRYGCWAEYIYLYMYVMWAYKRTSEMLSTGQWTTILW